MSLASHGLSSAGAVRRACAPVQLVAKSKIRLSATVTGFPFAKRYLESNGLARSLKRVCRRPFQVTHPIMCHPQESPSTLCIFRRSALHQVISFSSKEAQLLQLMKTSSTDLSCQVDHNWQKSMCAT